MPVLIPSNAYLDSPLILSDGFIPNEGLIPSEGGADCTCPFAGINSFATIKRPTSVQHFACIASGMPEPDYCWFGQELSGSIVDSVMGVQLAPVGATPPSYNNSVTDWTTKWLGLSQIQNQGFNVAAGNAWNLATQSVVTLCYGVVTAVGANTRVWQILAGTSPSSVFNSFNTTGFTVLHRAGVTSVGAINYLTGAAPHPYVTIWDVRNAGLYRLNTDREQLSVAWAQHPDGLKGITAAFNTLTPVMLINLWAIWVGTKAETVIDMGGAGLGGKTLVGNLGWTLTY